MKKDIKLVVLLLFALNGIIAAQPRGGKREKIETMKIGFITQKLDLTADEAQRFWPVYNKFSDETEKNKRTFRGKMMEELSNVDNLTEQESEKILSDMIAYKTSEVELIKKYAVEFKKVIPSQKVVKLFVAEQEFKKELLRKLREQRGN